MFWDICGLGAFYISRDMDLFFSTTLEIFFAIFIVIFLRLRLATALFAKERKIVAQGHLLLFELVNKTILYKLRAP
jgi:hypothetical protein